MIVFTFLVSIYISLGADNFRGAFLQAIPADFLSEISILFTRIERMWNSFFQGELRLMLLTRSPEFRQGSWGAFHPQKHIRTMSLQANDTFLALKIHDSLDQDEYPVGIKIRKDKNHGQDSCSCIR